MKNAVVTLSLGERSSRIGEVTQPVMRRYAERIGADFVVIDTVKIRTGDNKFEKFQIHDLLRDYDRILYLDIDVVVAPACPDLFARVAPDRFGAFFDSEVKDCAADVPLWRNEEIEDYQRRCGEIGWRRTHFNSGVMVVSKLHRGLFDYTRGLQRGKRYVDQTQLNYNLARSGLPWDDLGTRFNHLVALGRCPLQWERRWGAHLLHYAGFEHTYPEMDMFAAIRRDVAGFYESSACDVPGAQ